MSVALKTYVRVVGCLALAALALNARGADPAPTLPSNPRVEAAHAAMMHVMRCSQIEKMNVRNSAGDKIGTIEDLVINTETGKVSYAALGFGGFLGLGEKLFAVPWSDVHIRLMNSETYILLNVTKEELKAAPGFDKNNWPDFADPNFTKEIDNYYREHRANDSPKVGQR